MTHEQLSAIETRIEKLKEARWESVVSLASTIAHDDAPALLAEVGRLRAELEAAKVALYDMRFAYVNKDGDLPHQFEISARWEQDDTWKDLYFCSACIGRDHRNNPKYKYCPDCGARMDAEGEKDG